MRFPLAGHRGGAAVLAQAALRARLVDRRCRRRLERGRHDVAFRKKLKSIGVDVDRLLLRRHRRLGDRGDQDAPAARPGLSAAVLRTDQKRSRPADHGGRPDPHRRSRRKKHSLAGRCDLVAIAREALHDPNWPLHAAQALGADPEFARWPVQYGWWLTRREGLLRKLGLRSRSYFRLKSTHRLGGPFQCDSATLPSTTIRVRSQRSGGGGVPIGTPMPTPDARRHCRRRRSMPPTPEADARARLGIETR